MAEPKLCVMTNEQEDYSDVRIIQQTRARKAENNIMRK